MTRDNSGQCHLHGRANIMLLTVLSCVYALVCVFVCVTDYPHERPLLSLLAEFFSCIIT